MSGTRRCFNTDTPLNTRESDLRWHLHRIYQSRIPETIPHQLSLNSTISTTSRTSTATSQKKPTIQIGRISFPTMKGCGYDLPRGHESHVRRQNVLRRQRIES